MRLLLGRFQGTATGQRLVRFPGTGSRAQPLGKNGPSNPWEGASAHGPHTLEKPVPGHSHWKNRFLSPVCHPVHVTWRNTVTCLSPFLSPLCHPSVTFVSPFCHSSVTVLSLCCHLSVTCLSLFQPLAKSRFQAQPLGKNGHLVPQKGQVPTDRFQGTATGQRLVRFPGTGSRAQPLGKNGPFNPWERASAHGSVPRRSHWKSRFQVTATGKAGSRAQPLAKVCQVYIAPVRRQEDLACTPLHTPSFT